LKNAWHLKVNWFEKFDGSDLKKLQAASVQREYAPGEMVFAPTPSPQSVYLLEQGLVRIFRLSEAGGETSFGYITPGEVFGELAAFSDEPRESFAQAVRRSSVWRIPRPQFQQTLAARPGIVLEVSRQMGERMKRIESRVENLVFRDVRSRVADILLELGGDFGLEEAGGLLIDLPITQAELATLVGSTRQSVNVSLREFESEGLIGRKKRCFVLLKPDALRAAARFVPGS